MKVLGESILFCHARYTYMSQTLWRGLTLVPGTVLFSRDTGKAGMDQALAVGVTNFAWASGYAVGAPLGGALADPRGDALSYPFLTVVCLMTFLLLGRVA